jgi:hypothetical protein
MNEPQGVLLSQIGKLTRDQLALVPTPPGTATHRPVPHSEVVNALIETLGFRHIAVHREEYAASKDGMKFYGVLDLGTTFEGCRFSLAVRNSHDKSMRLSMVVGYRVFCCDNGAFSGDFEPIAAKHSKNFNLVEAVDIGVSQMQRNFEPMVKAVDRWRASQITDVTAKLMIYEAFVEGVTEFPRHLAREVHRRYFEPEYEEFQPRTAWSLSNAFTSAFKLLDPIPQYRATAALGTFLNGRLPR